MNKKSLRRERFENVAARRTQKILDLFDILGNCSNKSNYEYTEEDIKKIINTLQAELTALKAQFRTKSGLSAQGFKLRK